jgi:solute carrier family 25 thiamine pyrophosphate transporter 19
MVGYDPEGKELPQFAYGVAGAVSGFMTRAVSQPLDVLKIRLQLQEQPIKRSYYSKYHGMWHATHTILREEGVRAFWKGHNPAQLLSIVYGLVQFSSFEMLTHQIWNWLPVYVTVNIRPATHFICGGVSGCLATLASQPFDVIRTRFVAQGHPQVYSNMFDAARQIVVKEKFTGLYRGLVPTLIQIAPQTGFQFAFYSMFTSLWKLVHVKAFLCPQDNIGAVGGLACGSAAGMCAKVVVYPLDVIKKRLQMQGFGYGHIVVGSARHYRSFIHCARQVVTYEGFSALYKGLGPSVLKAIVTTGLHFSAYERCLAAFHNLHQSSSWT